MRAGWLVALSLVVSAAAIAVYSQLLRVPAVRNNPEGYVAAFAIAAVIAGLAVALGRRWYAWTALAVSLVLLLGGATFNFVPNGSPVSVTHDGHVVGSREGRRRHRDRVARSQ